MKSKFLAILTLIFALLVGTAYASGVNVDSGINFVTEKGEVISEFPDVSKKDYTMYATTTVKNEADLQKRLILFVSVYDGNNNLKKVSCDTITLPANGEGTGKVSVTIPKGTKAENFVCKAYLWDTIAGKVAYRTESVFLDLNTGLYGITIGDATLENYSDDTDFYSVQVAKADGEIKVYPKSGATSIEYSEINVPGTSTIKLVSGNKKREINIKTYLKEKDKYTLSSLKYKIGDKEYEVEGFDPDVEEYTVNLPVNTFYVALLPEAIGDVACTIQDINDSPNVINGVSFGKMRTDTTGPAYVYERDAIYGVVPIKNEHTKAYVNVTDGENTVEYKINFRSVQPRLTEFNLVGAEGDGYTPIFTSGAGFNNDNGTINCADRVWAAANISKKLIGASYFMSPFNNKGGGQWWNDVGKKGDEYFNFTADTAGTIYLMGSANLSEYDDWEKVNNGTAPAHPTSYTTGNKAWNNYDDTDYFLNCIKWNDNIGRCDICGVGEIDDSKTSYIDGSVQYKYVFAKHFEAGEKVSVKHTGSYGNSAAEIIWAVVWDVDVNYPDIEIPEVEEPEIEIDENIPEGLKEIAPYALNGYLYKQLNNNWADVTLSDETAENGVITTTAAHTGTLASGKRVATFQPWAKGQGTRENAAGAYTMHYGFTVKEVTSPLALAYKYDQGGTKYLAVLTEDKVIAGGSLDGSKYVEVTAPYTVNFFMNIQSGNGYVYVNDKLLYEGGMTNSSGDKKWHEVRVVSLEESSDIRFVTTAANSSIYKDDVSIEQVIKAYLGDDIIDGGDDEADNNIPEGIKNIASYGLSGYFYRQLNNNWAEITLSDETAENGVITTTATYEGTLASGKRVASFQPWDKNKPTLSKAQGAYTMHFGFTVNEITSPACLEYRFDASKKLISFSDSKVVWGDNMDGDTYIEVAAPYTIDIFMNVQTAKGIIYVNGQVLYDGTVEGASRFCNSGADTKWTEIRVKNLDAAEDFKLVTTAVNSSVYNDEVTLEEVIAAYMGDGESGEDPDEPEELPEAVKNLSGYALTGYFDKQINNFWAEVNLKDETDASGVITTTASYDGTLAKGKRVGTFQPWEEKGVGSNAAGEYTMHFGFTVKELTSPVYLEYNYSRNGGAKKTLISLSESRVAVGGDISGSTFVKVEAPYRIDVFMNIETCSGYIYVNGEQLYKGTLRNSGNDKTWREARIVSLAESSNIKLVTTGASCSIYNDSISIEDVIAAYMGNSEE